MSSLGERLAAARRARADEGVEVDSDAGQEWNPDDNPPAEPVGLVQASPYGSGAQRDSAPAEEMPVPVVGKRRADVPSVPAPTQRTPRARRAGRSVRRATSSKSSR